MLKQFARGMHNQAARFHFMPVGRSDSTRSDTGLSPFDTIPGPDGYRSAGHASVPNRS